MAVLPGIAIQVALEDQRFQSGIRNVERSTAQMASNVQRSTGVMRQAFSNVGFQIQDVVVQLQAGQARYECWCSRVLKLPRVSAPLVSRSARWARWRWLPPAPCSALARMPGRPPARWTSFVWRSMTRSTASMSRSKDTAI